MKLLRMEGLNKMARFNAHTYGADTKKAVLHVCRTGDKEQFYTLYVEVQCTYKDGGRAHFCKFVQNLAHKEGDAIDKATAFAQENLTHMDEAHMEVHPEPRPIYSKYEIFGIEMKMSKKRTTWWGNINADFWDMWKTQKAEIKAAGYWIKRLDGTWLLFKKVRTSEISWEAD